MATTPADIANQALDAIGIDATIGDLEEGSRSAQVLLRAYSQCLRQLLRAAHWNFARKQVEMLLLGDATGQTPYVGTSVQAPWTYCYAYPPDAVRARMVLAQSVRNTAPSIAIPDVPLMPGLDLTPIRAIPQFTPARFVEATDYNYPPFPGSVETQSISPVSRTVINTNVRSAILVYTAFIPHPTIWDAQFRGAFVAYLGSECALALHQDKKLALTVRQQQIAIAREKITQARLSDGNEGYFTTAHTPDWIRVRNAGSLYLGMPGFSGAPGDGGAGTYWMGYDSVGFSDGSSY